jgi:hypothetical protein
MTCSHVGCANPTPVARHGARGTRAGQPRRYCSDRCSTLAAKAALYARRAAAGACANCGRAPKPDCALCRRCIDLRTTIGCQRWAASTGAMTREMALRILGRTA